MGMDGSELIEVRPALEAFAAQVFAGFARSDQRATGLRYLRGLMLDGRRKPMQPMAERLGVDHQRLQQFLTSSTWDVTGCAAGWQPLRSRRSPRRCGWWT